MSGRDTGGPAFPRPSSKNDDIYVESQQGMSLRDWFAGMALQGLIACPTVRPSMKNEEYANISYGLADAMIAEREKER